MWQIKIVSILLILASSSLYAMRCTDSKGVGRIVQEGDNVVEVLLNCSEPDYKYSPGLLLDEEVWVYKRDDGMLYTINFLQGQVQSIDYQRR